MDKDLQKKLQECKSLDQMFDVIKANFETEKELSSLSVRMAANYINQYIPTICNVLLIKKRTNGK